MPIERRPANPLPKGYVPPGGLPFKVGDDDDWRSIARQFGVDVKALIEFNFKTRNPDEVNWYLRELVGCRLTTRDGLNWRFSAKASPGIIYIPIHIPAPTPPERIVQSIGTMSWIDLKLFDPQDLPEVDWVPPGPQVVLRDAFFANTGYRFANFLEGFIEVNGAGEIVNHGFTNESGLYYGRSFRKIMPEAYPVRRTARVEGRSVRFVQLVGCRTQSPEVIGGLEAARIASNFLGIQKNWGGPIGVQIQSGAAGAGKKAAQFFGVFPPIWTEVELTIHSDGSYAARVIRHSIFPSNIAYVPSGADHDRSATSIYRQIGAYDGTSSRLSEWKSKGWGSGNPWNVPDPRPLGADFPLRPDIPDEW